MGEGRWGYLGHPRWSDEMSDWDDFQPIFCRRFRNLMEEGGLSAYVQTLRLMNFQDWIYT